MKNYMLEICVDSAESALAAAAAGAKRLELCANLIIGGTSPGISLYETIREHSDIPMNVLLRPRFGDFCYTDMEFEIICREVTAFREAGADGVVIGILKRDGSLDVERMKVLMDAAGNMSVTLHRAFDMCKDPFEALKQAKELGIHTILTSGQQNSAVKGTGLLKELVEQSGGSPAILAGSGVTPDNLEQLYRETGATQYHMSAKTVAESPMIYRKEQVNMGLSGISEYEIWRTDAEAVKRAVSVLESL